MKNFNLFSKLFRPQFALSIGLAVLLTACPNDPPPPPPPPPTVIPQTTKVPDKTTRDALSQYNPSTGTMRFENTTPILDALAVGDVLVSEPSAAAPYGYLRKVGKISKVGAAVIVETSQAKLTDAISQGTVLAEGKLAPSQLQRVTPLSKGASGGVIQNDLHPQLSVGGGDGFAFEAKIDSTLEIEATGPNATGTLTIHFKGLSKFNVGYRFAVDIGLLADLNSVEASLGFNQEVSYSVSADAAGELKKEWEVARYDFAPIVVFVGPVPVVFIPSATVTLGVSGKASLHFDYAVAQTANYTQGARWDEDRGWSRINRNEFNVTHEGPNLTGEAELKTYERTNMRVLAYGLVGPDVGTTVGAKLNVVFPRDPLWKLFGFISGDVSFTVDLLGEEQRFNEELFYTERELASGAADPPVITVVKPSLEADLNSKVSLKPLVSVQDKLSAGVTFTSDKDAGAFYDEITFTTPGVRTITATAKNGAGKSAQAFFKVNVINTPPEAAQMQGAPFAIEEGEQLSLDLLGIPKDKNSTLTCDNVRWSVAGADSLLTENDSSIGCAAIAIFSEQGTRQVKVAATDPEGLSTERTFDVTVGPPLAVPSPQVSQIKNNDGLKRHDVVDSGRPLKFFVEVIKNPDNLAASYKWYWRNLPLGAYAGYTSTPVSTTSSMDVVAGLTSEDTASGKQTLCITNPGNPNAIYPNAEIVVEVGFAGIPKTQTLKFPIGCGPYRPR